MKAKDFFTTLKTQGKISNEEYDKFIEGVPEFDIPDNAFKAFEEKFMTVERASTNPDVVSRLRVQALNPIDNDLNKLIEIIGTVDKHAAVEISGLVRNGTTSPDTYKQLAAIAGNLPKLFDKIKAVPSDEDSKKTIAEQKRAIAELTEKFTGAQQDYEKKVKTAEDGYNNKITEFTLNNLLEKKAGSFTFADAYQDARPELTKAILGEIRGGNILELATKDNEDDIQIMELKDGVKIPKFNGNTPVTIDGLLEERFKKFTKQNGTDTQRQTTTFQYRDQGNDGKQQQARRGASTEVQQK